MSTVFLYICNLILSLNHSINNKFFITMKLKRFIIGAIAAAICAGPSLAAETDGNGYPEMYVCGKMTENWKFLDEYKMTRTADVYTISLPSLDGEFKISNEDWTINYGSENAKGTGAFVISDAATVVARHDTENFHADNLRDVTLTIRYVADGDTYLQVAANGKPAPSEPTPTPTVPGVSGTLPVLFINVYADESKTEFDNEIIDRNLDHKNYFAGEYWLDLNGCEWLEAEGAESIGSKEAPLPLEIKARGNYTRKAFAKKPFKLKLGKKQSLLGLSKSKHFAILAHADDNFGYLRNFTGFNLGRRIGLPWTPWQQPVEVVINGDYRGLYFLTESIRVDADRVNITELDDLVSDPAIVSGGYLVELDNYDEENQIRMPEKTCADVAVIDMLRVTWDTPEEYSDLQKRFITDQFTAMNDAVGDANKSDELWKYMDMDDAVRYYIVEELISHTEAYHGSTYLFRDRGEGQKWHFSPLWDCGNGFNGPSDQFFYNATGFGATWIPAMRCNDAFNRRLADTWLWFMNNGFNGIYDDMAAYAARIKAAAQADRKRWKDAPRPDFEGAQAVADNTDMEGRLRDASAKLAAKTEWLKTQFGDFAANPSAPEPERDATEAAPLPPYAKETLSTTIYFIDQDTNPWKQPYAYMWGGEPNYEGFGAWPGTAMTPAIVDGAPAWSLTIYDDALAREASPYKLIFNDGLNGTGLQTDSFDYAPGGVYSRTGIISGINSAVIDGTDAPAEYFNLQGMRVAAPRAGETYIRLSGDSASKVRM